MNRKSSKPFLLLIATVFLFMSIPRNATEHLSGLTMAFMAPFWGSITDVRLLASSPMGITNQATITPTQEELEKLKLQNLLLVREIERLREALHFKKNKISTPIAARVIFRSPSSWNSSLWIDVGRVDNASAGEQVIAKNSPVLVGNALVGVVDYVGEHQARVRLITDSGLTPSVRASRGHIQNRWAIENINRLLTFIDSRPQLLSESQKPIASELQKLKKLLLQSEPSWNLAKGELHGGSKPLWRSQGNLLRGIGFNYDFADEEGPARDLRTGASIGANTAQYPLQPLLKPDDLLITTGLDGVFPPGLLVAEVTKIDLLREGDYYYSLEAKPVVDHLDELSVVFVIPPLGYDPLDQPPCIGD